MKKLLIFTLIVYIFLFVCGSVYAVGERTISLGAGATWKAAENRTGITEASSIRPHPVLLLSSSVAVTSAEGYQAASGVWGNFSALTGSALDLSVSFDERTPELFRDSSGNYKLSVPPEVESVDRVLARAGAGAALFGRYGYDPESTPIVIQPDSRNALFAPGNRIKDFTVEFWLYPLNMENGEQILSWASTMPGSRAQRIDCSVSKNKLKWSFVNFFTPINGSRQINIDFTSLTPVVPKTWSHHLVRFDAATGMLEYIVDGKGESIVYATSTGRENSEVHIPVIGDNGRFLLGGRFSGFIDEFKIHSVCAGRSTIQRYASCGGRIETKPVDMGTVSSGVVKINACGGRTSIKGTALQNEFRENGRFKFSDDAEMNFFVRAGENPYSMENIPWVIFTPGSDISGVRGRYVQIAVDFYPSADGECSPYLEQVIIVFMQGEAPLPPRNLTAIAKDGAVQLRWKQSPTTGTAGYLVYYSAVRGELFGNDSKLGPSPIDVGITTNINIDGLKNGTLYYFRVTAYDLAGGNRNIGDFSAEVTARPLTGLK
ncbi:LamG-like jellyroll fold domain-containing protein [Treponema sp. R80B11-R83G3]